MDFIVESGHPGLEEQEQDLGLAVSSGRYLFRLLNWLESTTWNVGLERPPERERKSTIKVVGVANIVHRL